MVSVFPTTIQEDTCNELSYNYFASAAWFPYLLLNPIWYRGWFSFIVSKNHFSLSVCLLRWRRCFLTYDPVSHDWKSLSHKVSDEQTSCFHFLLHDVTLIHCAHILCNSLPVFQCVFVCLISTFGAAFYSDFQIPDFVVKQRELGFAVHFCLYYDLHSLHEFFWHFLGIHCVSIFFSY